MEENQIKEKVEYLKSGFIEVISGLDPQKKGLWGKMNAQQMVEHLSDSFRQANERLPVKPALTQEQTDRAYKFLMSEKPFKENTVNPLLSGEPDPLKNASMTEAIEELKGEINHFFEVFESDSGKRVLNPFYGNLSYEEQVRLLFKHTRHHARQFGL